MRPDTGAVAPPQIRRLGRCDYESTWRAMQHFTESRGPETADEIWLVEHPPLFTQGRNGKPEHLLDPGEIPVVAVDRGGQVTYHGPGQAVLYTLLDLRRRRLGVRHLVTALEEAVVALLDEFGVSAHPRADAPGVYITRPDGGEAKIASRGLRVRRGCSYHGLALNVAMDKTPFDRINPCGLRGMAVTQLTDLAIDLGVEAAGERLAAALLARLPEGPPHR